MNKARIFGLSALVALALANSTVQAQDGNPPGVRLGEHPAVIVARKGVQKDPTANFSICTRLAWSGACSRRCPRASNRQ